MRVFEEKQWFNQWWLIPIYVFLIGFPLIACYKWFVLSENFGNVGPSDWDGILTILIIFPIIIIFLSLFRLDTIIDERGILYQFRPMNKSLNLISWDEIKECQVKQYRPLLEFGGWGYKWGRKGTKAVTVKGNQGIFIELKNGQRLLIGTQKPKGAQQVVYKYCKNEGV